MLLGLSIFMVIMTIWTNMNRLEIYPQALHLTREVLELALLRRVPVLSSLTIMNLAEVVFPERTWQGLQIVVGRGILAWLLVREK